MDGLHPNIARRWRRDLHWRTQHAARRLADWQALSDLLLAHEPTADAWLRRRLAELDAPGEDKGIRL